MAAILALSGFMGSGKSAVGRVVAERLGLRFVDLDAEVESAEGVRIAELFAEGGEVRFREAEHRSLERILARSRASDEGLVLALGGGTVTWPASARALSGVATVVLLEAPLADQWARAARTGRPLAASAEAFARLAEERHAVYLRTADAVVDTTGLDIEAAAAAVISAVAPTGVRSGPPGTARP